MMTGKRGLRTIKDLRAAGKRAILHGRQPMSSRQLVTYVLWIAPAAVQGAIAARLRRTKLYREFPAFFVYTVVHLLRFCVLFSLYHLSFKTYFVAYWIAEALDAVLGFYVIREIYAHVFGRHAALQKLGNVLFQWCAAVLILVATVTAASTQGADSDRWIAAILALDHSVALVKTGLLLFLFFFSRFFGLTWRHYVLGIAAGLGVYTSVEVVGVAMRIQTGLVSAATYALVKGGAYNCSAVIWFVYFFKRYPIQAHDQVLPPTDLDRWNDALADLVRR